jgi:hypothetical protein
MYFEKPDESDFFNSCMKNTDNIILLNLFDQGKSRNIIINKLLLLTTTSKNIFNLNVISAIEGINYNEFDYQENNVLSSCKEPIIQEHAKKYDKEAEDSIIGISKNIEPVEFPLMQKKYYPLSNFTTNKNYNPTLFPVKKEIFENSSINFIQSPNNNESSSSEDEQYCNLL